MIRDTYITYILCGDITSVNQLFGFLIRNELPTHAISPREFAADNDRHFMSCLLDYLLQ